MTKKEISAEFDKSQKLLHALSTACSKRCGRPEPEIYGEACFWFMKATESFDPTRGTFSTYMYRIVHNQLIQWGKKNPLAVGWDYEKAEHPGGSSLCEDFYDEDRDLYPPTPTYLTPDKALSFKEWVLGLSKECQEVINIILEGPAEVLEIGLCGNEKRLLACIKNYLRKIGWSYPTIWDTMRTLKREVRSL